jgi:hypothetical protein
MTKLAPSISSKKTLSITLQSPQETYQGTPTTLPTSEPSAGNEQISYTVQSSDLPTFNIQPESKTWIAIIHAAGKFVTAGTLNYRMKKNGVSVSTGSSSVAANTFYTRMLCFYNVQVGDVLKVSLWSNRSDSNWDYNSYMVYPTRISLSNRKRALAFVTFSNLQGLTLSQGNPTVKNSASAYGFHDEKSLGNITEGMALSLLYNGETNNYGLFRVAHGDYSTADGSPTPFTDATYHPAYWREDIPTTVTFRFLDV